MVIIVVPCIMLLQINASSYLQWAFYAIGVTIYAIIVVLTNAILFDRTQLKSVLKRIKMMIGEKK